MSDLWSTLDDAERAVAEAATLERRLASARSELAAEHGRLRGAREALDLEDADVARLERVGPTRIWAALRGVRDAELTRERAEQQAALYAHAAQEQRVARAREHLRTLEAARARLGDVEAGRRRALDAVEQALVEGGGPHSAALADVAVALGTASARQREVAEAITAAAHADTALGAAADLLGRAGDWATYDTFLGGGLLTDAMKYQRMDEAEARLRDADAALRALARELADLGQAGVDGVAVSGLLTTFDVWFDNIFSDWSVRSRIREAAERTDEAARRLADLRERLEAERRRLSQEIDGLGRRRAEILAAARG